MASRSEMVLLLKDRKTGEIMNHVFKTNSEIIEYFKPEKIREVVKHWKPMRYELFYEDFTLG